MVSIKYRMLAENVGHGTISSVPMIQASFAPRKIVKRRVGGAEEDVARDMMRSKSDFNLVEV